MPDKCLEPEVFHHQIKMIPCIYHTKQHHLSKSVTKTFEFPQKNGSYDLKALFNSFKTRYEPKYLVEGFTRNGVLNFFSKIYHSSIWDNKIIKCMHRSNLMVKKVECLGPVQAFFICFCGVYDLKYSLECQ